MWTQYRKTLVPVQLLILIVCTYLVVIQKFPIGAAAVFFALPMELAAFIGALWASRLKRKIDAAQPIQLTGK